MYVCLSVFIVSPLFYFRFEPPCVLQRAQVRLLLLFSLLSAVYKLLINITPLNSFGRHNNTWTQIVISFIVTGKVTER